MKKVELSEKEMESFMNILERKGYVIEPDNVYAYSMQYAYFVEAVVNWLENHGYKGDLRSIGAYDGVATYGLYDENIVSYETVYQELLKEARRQSGY